MSLRLPEVSEDKSSMLLRRIIMLSRLSMPTGRAAHAGRHASAHAVTQTARRTGGTNPKPGSNPRPCLKIHPCPNRPGLAAERSVRVESVGESWSGIIGITGSGIGFSLGSGLRCCCVEAGSLQL